MERVWRCFAHDEGGATAIEYALIAAFIAIAIISGAQAIGVDLVNIFQNVTNFL